LEDIIHPYVVQAVNLLVKRATQKVVVIEAIKLLESGLGSQCGSIWVTYAPEEVQIERLVRKRGLSYEDARQRVHAQSSYKEKLAAATIVIKNTGSYDDLWRQVTDGWKTVSPTRETGSLQLATAEPGEFKLHRGRPRDSQKIAELITRLSKHKRTMNKDDVMEAFGEKAFLLLQMNDELVGVAGWQVENLVARTDDLFLDPKIPPDQALPLLIHEVELASSDLQCEASLIFPPRELVGFDLVWKKLGYVQRTPGALGAQAWIDAANESMPTGSTLLFKQLRTDRVLRPI
jgi:dephospho-CoA kinase